MGQVKQQVKPTPDCSLLIDSVTHFQVRDAQQLLKHLDEVSNAVGVSRAEVMHHVQKDTGDSVVGGDGVYGCAKPILLM